MQVGEKVAGEAGYLYAILSDSWTLGNVKQWNGLASGEDYHVSDFSFHLGPPSDR